MTDQIFFFHNPKAGGSSLRMVFGSHFSPERQCPVIENDKVGHEQLNGKYGNFRGYHYYAGHYGRDIFEAVHDGHLCITNFRNPTARIISLYNYFRFDVELPEKELCSERFRAVAFAKSASFEKFVSSVDPDIDVYVRNAHFRQLANSCWALETTRKLDDVCRLVDEMPWYYVCEYPALSIAWFEREFAWDLRQMPRENVTRTQNFQPIVLTALDDRIRALILEKNDLDFALYQYAVSRLVTKVSPIPTRLGKTIREGARAVAGLLPVLPSKLRG